MLILSRNKGQKIIVNGNIVISVVDLGGDQVRIGIDAPSNITIYREEIYEAIQKQNKEAVVEDSNIQDLLLNANLAKKNK